MGKTECEFGWEVPRLPVDEAEEASGSGESMDRRSTDHGLSCGPRRLMWLKHSSLKNPCQHTACVKDWWDRHVLWLQRSGPDVTETESSLSLLRSLVTREKR